jgi:hypothetical protein
MEPSDMMTGGFAPNQDQIRQQLDRPTMFDQIARPEAQGPLGTQDPTKAISEEQRQASLASFKAMRLEIEQQNERDRVMAMRDAMQFDPNKVAKARSIATGLGVPESSALDNFDVLKKIYDEREAINSRTLAANPVLREAFENPLFARIAHDSIEQLGSEEGLWKSWTDAWRAGRLIDDRGLIYAKMAANIATPEDQIRLKQVEREMREIGPVQGFLPSAIEIAGQLRDALPVVLGGAAVGWAAGAVTGPGSIFSAAGGAGAAIFAHSAMVEGGNAYGDMIEQGYDPETSAASALGIGIAAGALEVFGAKLATSWAKGIFRKELQAQVTKAVTSKTTGRAWKDFGINYAKSSLGEAGTEALQEVAQIVGDEIARTSREDLDSRFSSLEGIKEMASRITEVMTKSVMGMSVLGLPGPAFRLFVDSRKAVDATVRKENLEKIIEATKNPVQLRSPKDHEEFLLKQTKTYGGENAYIDAKDLLTVLDGLKVPHAEFVETFKESVTADLNSLAESGSDVVIPSAHLLSRIQRTDLQQALTEHVRFDPGEESYFQAQQLKQASEKLEAAAEKAIQQTEQGREQFLDSAQKVLDEFVENVSSTSRVQPRQARALGTLYRNFVVVQAARLKKDPYEYHKQYQLTFGVRGKVAEKAEDFTEQGERRVDTEEFKAWFGSSKLAGPDGAPTRFYVQMPKEGEVRPYRGGVVMAEARPTAQPGQGPSVTRQVYASIKNPMVVTELPEAVTKAENPAKAQRAYVDGLRSRGFDGLVVGEAGNRTIIAFSPSQIRYASMREEVVEEAGSEFRHFIGSQGATPSQEMRLTQAQELDTKGATAEETKAATGWFKGPDGKWRLEITDADAKIVVPSNLHSVHFFDITWGMLHRAKMADLQGVDNLDDADPEASDVRLDDIMQHKKLFAAYPALRDIKVIMVPDSLNPDGRTKGFFSSRPLEVLMMGVVDARDEYLSAADLPNSVIAVAPNVSLDEARSIILHELQHAIQQVEKFAEGGQPDVAAAYNPNAYHREFSHAFYRIAKLTGKVQVGKRKVLSLPEQDIDSREFLRWLNVKTGHVYNPQTGYWGKARSGGVRIKGNWKYLIQKYVKSDYLASKISSLDDVEFPSAHEMLNNLLADATRTDGTLEQRQEVLITANNALWRLLGMPDATTTYDPEQWPFDVLAEIDALATKQGRMTQKDIDATVRNVRRAFFSLVMSPSMPNRKKAIAAAVDDPAFVFTSDDQVSQVSVRRLGTQVEELINAVYNKYDHGPEIRFAKDQAQFKMYQRLYGEAEARLVEAHKDIPQEALDRFPPYHMLDLPSIDDVIVTFGSDNLQLTKILGMPANAVPWTGELSTRLPSGRKKSVIENPVMTMYTTSIEAAFDDAKAFTKNVETIRNFPFLHLPEGLTEKEIAQKYIAHVVDNLLWLYDGMDPKLRERAKLWYDGGQKYADKWAVRYGMSPMQTAAAIAVLSPQANWFENMSMAERILDVLHAKKDHVFDEKMEKMWGLHAAKSAKKLKRTLDDLRGKSMRDLLDAKDYVSAGIYARLYDQAYNDPRTPILSPEGGFVKLVKNKIRWKSYTAIIKAVSVYADGSRENISRQLGNAHKVRNFYNNLFAPYSRFGHVTIDTHAVAAAYLLPLAATHQYVNQAWGGQGGATSVETGLLGLYPYLQEAYRQAAASRGILPREMQSITWEMVRVLFEDKQKTASTRARAKMAQAAKDLADGKITQEKHDQIVAVETPRDLFTKAEKVWALHKEGKLTQADARTQISDLYNGFAKLAWESSKFDANVGSTYEGPSRDASAALETATPVAPRLPSSSPFVFSRDLPQISVEVAPDPDNAELTARWNTLSDTARYMVSKAVINTVVPQVLREFGVDGAVVDQMGAWKGATNPSFAVVLSDPSVSVAFAGVLGDLLQQQGMWIMSTTNFSGGSQSGAVEIGLPEGFTAEQVRDLNEKLYALEVNGNRIAIGSSTIGNYMLIGRDSSSPVDLTTMANTIAAALDEKFTVRTMDVFNAMPEKGKDYARTDSAAPQAGGAAAPGSPSQQRLISLRDWANWVVESNVDAILNEPVERTVEPRAAAEPGAEFAQGAAAGIGAEPAAELNAPTVLGTYRPRDFTAFLYEEGNFSTFLHEMSHHFLHVLMLTAGNPGADIETRTDAMVLLNWFESQGMQFDPDLDEAGRVEKWNSMSVDEQRPYHEAWAYNWELFVHEGKSPSKEMESLFDRFRRWIINCYNDIKATLNQAYREEFNKDLPALTPEVEGVMMRLIASEEQIQRALAVRGLAPLFMTLEQAKEAGISKDEWEELQALDEEQKQEAVLQLTNRSMRNLQWVSRATSRHLKEIQKKHDAQRAVVREEVRKKVLNEPIYRALMWFRYGTVSAEVEISPEAALAGDEVPSIDKKPRLSIDAVREYFPDDPDIIKKLGTHHISGVLGKEGMDPDTVAKELFGFENGAAFLRALLAARPFEEEVDYRTDQRMLTEHGDLVDEAQRTLAVQKALHNEARTRFVAAELKMVERSTSPLRIMTAAAKQAAKSILSRRSVRSVMRTRDYDLAEARAAKRAMDAMADKNMAAVIEAKRQQLVQGAMTKEAIDIRENIESKIDNLTKFFKQDPTLAKSRNMVLVNAGRAILTYYGLGERGVDADFWIKEAQQMDPAMLVQVMDAVAASAKSGKSYKDLTVNEFNQMVELVEELWHESRRENVIKIGDRLVELVDITANLLGDMQKFGDREVIPGEIAARTYWERSVDKLLKLRAQMTRVETWCDIMGPSFTNFIWRPVREALSEYKLKRNELTKKLMQYMKELPVKRGTIDATNSVGYTFGSGNGGFGVLEVVGALLHMGNASNRRKFFLGREVKVGPRKGQRWGVERADGTIDSSAWDAFIQKLIDDGVLTEQHFDFVQKVWDLCEDMKPMAQKAHYERFGYRFTEVQALPFEVTFADGTKKTFRGGYYPAKTDRSLDYNVDSKAEMAEVLADFKYALPATESGFTEERVEYNKPLSMDLGLMVKHVDDVVKFSLVEPTLNNTLKIINRPEFRDRLNRIDPTAYKEVLIPWLNRCARQSTSKAGSSEIIDSFWSALRNNAGLSIMFANISNSVQSLTGLMIAATKVPPAKLARSVWRVATRQVDAKAIANHSKFMDIRFTSEIHDTKTQIDRVLLQPNKYQKVNEWAKAHGYFLQKAFQNFIDSAVWDAAFNDEMSKRKADLSDADSVKEAVAVADAAVRQTQSSLEAEDIASYEVGTPFQKALFQFSNYFNMMANLNAANFTKLWREMRGGMFFSGRTYMMYMLGFGLPMLVGDAIAKSFAGSWDEEDDEDDGFAIDAMQYVFGSQMRGATAMIPGFGPSIMAGFNAFNDKTYDDRMMSNPSVTAIERGVKAVANVTESILSTEDEVRGSDIRGILTLLGLGSSVAASAAGAARPIYYGYDWWSGQVEPLGSIDAARGMITGRAAQESKVGR